MRKKIALHVLYIAVIVAYTFLIGCPINKLTGFDCPFCGMTRAHISFLKGEFAVAFGYHELFFLGIPFILGIAHSRVLKKKKPLFIADMVFIFLTAAALIIRYIIKLTI